MKLIENEIKYEQQKKNNKLAKNKNTPLKHLSRIKKKLYTTICNV